MSARLPQILLALVFASVLVLWAVASMPEPVGGVARAHPEVAHMLVAPHGSSGGALGLVLGWTLGALQIGFFVGCFALGVSRRGALGGWRRWIVVGFVLYQAIWLATMLAYRDFVSDPTAALVGSLPSPSAWMLYGLWPAPLFFAVLFWWRFEKDFLSERDLEQFRARLAELPTPDRD